MESKGLLELNVRNPYFQLMEEKNKKEHCRFCQSSVNLTHCKECDEITKKECHECNWYEEDNFTHICEMNFSGFSKRE
jgi:hypothetical protein